MSNKVNAVNSSSLLDNKLAVLFKEYNELVKSEDVSQQEQLLLIFNELISKFYATLNNPLFTDEFLIKTGDIVDYKKLNGTLDTAQKDVQILYKEANSLENAIVRNFNNLVSFGDKIKNKLRTIRSNVATYKLYSNNRDLHFIADSFDNYSLIEQQNKLYNSDRCNVNLNEGTVTLPVDTGQIKELKFSDIEIGPSSNGTPGNNQEIGQLQRASLNNLADNNPDTWFEYELVNKNPIKTPLVIDLRLTLEEESIINNIEIRPNSFAVRNFPKIIQLKTSLDGNFFVDLIDDIPISNEQLEDKDDLLVLSPSSGKYTGISSFSFKPRKAKYIQLKIQQDENYIVKTPAGLQYRKAIGIRTLLVKSVPYKAKGELVSIAHATIDEIKKLGLSITSNTFDDLTAIESQVTHDDNNWLNITPLEDTDSEEVINFNTIDKGSIKTDSPVAQIRYKAILTRNTDKFSQNDTVIKTEELNSEFLSVDPSTSSVLLVQTPIPSSVQVFGVAYGRVGDKPLHISENDIVTLDDFLLIQLPKAFLGKTIDPSKMKFIVNKEPWTQVASLSGAAATDKFYEFDEINNIIKTGNDTTGKKPAGTLEVLFNREQILFSSDSPRIGSLNFSSDSVKDSVDLYKLGQLQSITGQVLQKGARILRLGKQEIDSVTLPVDPTFITEKTYVNGGLENTIAGDYSIDYINGIIYTYTVTPENTELTIDFDYSPRTEISNFEISGDELTISDGGYSSEEFEETQVLVAAYRIHLNKNFVEPKSIQNLSPALASNFVREVPFTGNGDEFQLDLTPTELAGLYTVDYKNGIVITNSPVTGSLTLKYRFTSIFAEYNIARPIIGNYTVEENEVKFRQDFIIDEFGDSLVLNPARNLYKVDYKFIKETHDNLKDLEKFYTPFLRDYILRIVPRSNF